MTKSVVKLVAILLIIFLIVWVAISGLEIGRDFNLPGIVSRDANGDLQPNPDGIILGLDLVGGSVIEFEADLPEGQSATYEQMASAAQVLRRRLDSDGYHEATVERQGSDQLRVEIPGMDNPVAAADMLGSVGLLAFVGGDGAPIMTGGEVVHASVSNEPTTPHGPREWHINFELTEAGRQAFSAATGYLSQHPERENANENFTTMAAGQALPVADGGVFLPDEIVIPPGSPQVLWNSIAIILDNEVISSPRVQQQLDMPNLIITGDFTREGAQEIANIINAGRMEVPLRRTTLNQVSATLGEGALNTSVLAGLIGLLLILLFMLIMYRLPGLMACLAIITFVGIFGIIMVNFNMNLTLPGIAGILLTIGMAIDAEILIFERIKEELRLGKTTRAAVDSGFRRALPAILDAEITLFIIAAILVLSPFGFGPLVGFGIKLMIGVIVSLFTALVVTQILIKLMVGLNLKQPWLYGVAEKSKGGEA